MIDIALAHTFRDSTQINTDCTIKQSFGKGVCEPNDFEIELFNLINRIRAHPNDPEILNRLKEWRDSHGELNNPELAYLDFNQDGVVEHVEINGG